MNFDQKVCSMNLDFRLRRHSYNSVVCMNFHHLQSMFNLLIILIFVTIVSKANVS